MGNRIGGFDYLPQIIPIPSSFLRRFAGEG